MVYCVAYRCHNRSKRGSGISFFNFPSDPVRRKIWTQNINRANFTPTKYSRLCSDHFERDCYEKHVDDMARIGYQGGYNKLKPDAIPTIFYSRDVSKYKFKRADGDNTKVSVRSTMRFRRQSNRPRRAYGKRQHNYGDIEKISAQEDGRLFDKHLQLKSSSESREQVDQEDIVRDYVSDRSKKTDRLNTFEENLVKVLKSSTTKSQKRALSPVHQKSKKLKLNEKNNKDLYKDDSQSEKSQKANIVDLKATEVRTEEETVLHPNSLKSKPPELSEKITASVESTEEFTSLIEKNDSSNPNQNSEVRTSTDFSEEPANETDLSFLSDEAERYSDRPNKDCIMKEANGRDMKVPKTNGIDNKSSASNVTVKHENILTKSMLEQLVSEKILECLSEGSKNEIASLKQKCLILEKSVERWKKKAHELQKHIAMVLSGKRNCAGCWKGKVATRSVGLYVRMPSGGIASPLNQIRQSGIAHTSGKQVFMPPSKMSTSFVKDVGTRSSSIPPIPVHLIANAATSQAVTVGAHRPIETTSSHSIIKVIDLTREKKENSKLGSLVTSIPEVSTSASNTGYYRLLQTVNSSTVNLQTPVLNSAGSVLTTASSNTTTTQKSTSDTVVTPGSMQNTINLTCTSGTVMISCVSQHPAPLPEATLPSDVKDLPPKPALKASRVVNGIVLSWNMMLNGSYPTVVTYQLYGYQESARPPSTSMWKKVGDIKALPLPMACTLTQFVEGHKYHFAVRAVDVQKRIGAFSNPAFIFLSKQASSTS
ncbi:uncharacterized protein LOC143254425 isoform X5 [Tachypleus tridentatus]|uniref:uncharacterized protein LOC143254425 isoform X5 n=1 Tax=Tachypleus tridentatus TaxID=6853 RepID=UPI003FD3A4F4